MFTTNGVHYRGISNFPYIYLTEPGIITCQLLESFLERLNLMKPTFPTHQMRVSREALRWKDSPSTQTPLVPRPNYLRQLGKLFITVYKNNGVGEASRGVESANCSNINNLGGRVVEERESLSLEQREVFTDSSRQPYLPFSAIFIAQCKEILSSYSCVLY